MFIRRREEVRAIKESLLEKLKQENAFWSYAPESVALDNLPDAQLIVLTLTS